jgi:molybdopterin synthase sulfur carrier subunit
MITVLYFARLREALGTGLEQVVLPPGIKTLNGLRSLLIARGGVWAEALGPGRPIRVAVNQDMAAADTPIAEGDEIAFFPPVTGG